MEKEFEINETHTVEMRKFQKGDMRKCVLNGAGEVVAKECKTCRLVKVMNDYYLSSKAKDGTKPACIDCNKKRRIERYEHTKEREKMLHKVWRHNNYEKLHIRNARHYEKNKDYSKKKLKEWRQNNPHKVISYNQTRRAQLKNLETTLTSIQLAELLELQNNKCILSDSTNLHLEHFIPLSWNCGGTTFENCYYLDASLNISKGNRNPFKWIETQPEPIKERFYNVLVPMLAERNGMEIDEYIAYVYQCEYEYILQSEQQGIEAS